MSEKVTPNHIISDPVTNQRCFQDSHKIAKEGKKMKIPSGEEKEIVRQIPLGRFEMGGNVSPREWTVKTWDNTDGDLRIEEQIVKKSKSRNSPSNDGEEKFDEKFDYATGESDSQSDLFTEADSSDSTYGLQIERPENIKFNGRSKSTGDEKFDLFSATESLRIYCNKLQSEKKKAKEKERVAALQRLGRDPSSTQRYEELYKMGKSKIISEKDNSKVLDIKVERQTNSQSPSPQEVMDRLYGRSIPMQNFGRDRREEISKMRALSNTRNPIKVNFAPSPCPFPTSPTAPSPKSGHPSPSPTPEEVMERLYSRSLPMSEYGKERREEINKMRAQSNPKKPPQVKRSVSSPDPSRGVSPSRHVRNGSFNASQLCGSSSTPEEVMERLYSRSRQMQVQGRERREEVREKSFYSKC